MNDVLRSLRTCHGGRFQRAKRLCWLAAGSCALSGLYAGRICRTWLRYTRMEMPLPNLPEALEATTLVHISDLHCSPIVLDRYLREVIEHVNAERPDFVAITGDLITGGTHYAKRVARRLGDLQARIASVACLGNHDFGIYHPRGRGGMRQLPGYLACRLFDAGVHVLRNQRAVLGRDGATLQLVGVDDIWSDRYDPRKAFHDVDPGRPTIALAHNPDASEDLIARGAHWVLSGHTHGNAAGERRLRDAVFPVEKPHFAAGHYRLDGGDLYVNRGLSYARRMPLNKRPEITVFTLRSA